MLGYAILVVLVDHLRNLPRTAPVPVNLGTVYPSLLHSVYRVSVPKVKRPGLVIPTHPYLVPRLKKE